MPESKHNTKNRSHSQWKRIRNIRKAHSKRISSEPQVDMVDSNKSLEKTHSRQVNQKQKGFFRRTLDGIRSVLVGRGKNSRGAV